MKRVLPLLLLISAIEVYFFIVAGKWLFDKRYVNVSEISIVKRETINNQETHIITFIQNSKEYRSCMSEPDYNYFYKKHNQLSYMNCDTYVFLGVLYIIFIILFGIYFIIRTVDFFTIYNSDADIGERFNCYESLLPESIVNLYNYIDSYNLTPFIKQLYKFFGYET